MIIKCQTLAAHLEKLDRSNTLEEIKKEMAQVNVIRNGIIDKLLALSDKDYLMALLYLIDNSAVQEDKIKLTNEQKLRLEISKADIKNGRTISQNDLDKNDLE